VSENPFTPIRPQTGEWAKVVPSATAKPHTCALPLLPLECTKGTVWVCWVCGTNWECMSIPPARFGANCPDPGAWSDRQPAGDRFGPDNARWCAWGWRNARRLRRAGALTGVER
jgi:hypothetical protein